MPGWWWWSSNQLQHGWGRIKCFKLLSVNNEDPDFCKGWVEKSHGGLVHHRPPPCPAGLKEDVVATSYLDDPLALDAQRVLVDVDHEWVL